MSDCCGGSHSETPPVDPKYRRVLWIALVINATMFGVEFFGGLKADSVSLLADAVDFLGDAGNYALSLFVLGLAPVWRSRTALFKGLSMSAYGIFVLAKAAFNLAAGDVPDATTMTTVGIAALIANITVAMLLFAYRNGDANMRSVWLCTRNDAIANIAVILAAFGVFGTGSNWPDILVAVLISALALTGARSVIVHSRHELKSMQHNVIKPVSHEHH